MMREDAIDDSPRGKGTLRDGSDTDPSDNWPQLVNDLGHQLPPVSEVLLQTFSEKFCFGQEPKLRAVRNL